MTISYPQQLPSRSRLHSAQYIMLHTGNASLMRRVYETFRRIGGNVPTLYKVNDISPPLPEMNDALPTSAKTQQLLEAHAEIDNLKSQLANASEKIGGLENLLQERNNYITSLNSEIEKLRVGASSMRSIILENTGRHEITDQRVKDKFTVIRQKVHKLAYHSMCDRELMPSRERAPNDSEMLFPSKYWSQLTVTDRRNRLIGKIFNILCCNIFETRIFSAAMPDLNAAAVLEESLASFENILEKNEVSSRSIVDWRMATIECMKGIVSAGSEPRLGVAEFIFRHLEIQFKGSTQEEERDMKNLVEGLCKDAYELSILFRSSANEYACRDYADGKRWLLTDFEAQVEPICVEGGSSNDASDEISFAMFGALVKRVVVEGKKREIVLEKARVVLKSTSAAALGDTPGRREYRRS